ncbi:MAG: hypothetical protein HYW49_13860 [Deltaproteobacteria bacterium]|nr:hypothetical protein [Deltaproteobacteria bacterium]
MKKSAFLLAILISAAAPSWAGERLVIRQTSVLKNYRCEAYVGYITERSAKSAGASYDSFTPGFIRLDNCKGDSETAFTVEGTQDADLRAWIDNSVNQKVKATGPQDYRFAQFFDFSIPSQEKRTNRLIVKSLNHDSGSAVPLIFKSDQEYKTKTLIASFSLHGTLSETAVIFTAEMDGLGKKALHDYFDEQQKQTLPLMNGEVLEMNIPLVQPDGTLKSLKSVLRDHQSATEIGNEPMSLVYYGLSKEMTNATLYFPTLTIVKTFFVERL